MAARLTVKVGVGILGTAIGAATVLCAWEAPLEMTKALPQIYGTGVLITALGKGCGKLLIEVPMGEVASFRRNFAEQQGKIAVAFTALIRQRFPLLLPPGDTLIVALEEYRADQSWIAVNTNLSSAEKTFLSDLRSHLENNPTGPWPLSQLKWLVVPPASQELLHPTVTICVHCNGQHMLKECADYRSSIKEELVEDGDLQDEVKEDLKEDEEIRQAAIDELVEEMKQNPQDYTEEYERIFEELREDEDLRREARDELLEDEGIREDAREKWMRRLGTSGHQIPAAAAAVPPSSEQELANQKTLSDIQVQLRSLAATIAVLQAPVAKSQKPPKKPAKNKKTNRRGNPTIPAAGQSIQVLQEGNATSI